MSPRDRAGLDRRELLGLLLLGVLVGAPVAAWVADRPAPPPQDTEAARAAVETMARLDSLVASVRHKYARIEPLPEWDGWVLVSVQTNAEPAGASGDIAMEADPEAHLALPPPEFNVGGIMMHRGRSVALINGGVVGEGDEIEGCRVERIGNETVLLRTPEGSHRVVEVYRDIEALERTETAHEPPE